MSSAIIEHRYLPNIYHSVVTNVTHTVYSLSVYKLGETVMVYSAATAYTIIPAFTRNIMKTL